MPCRRSGSSSTSDEAGPALDPPVQGTGRPQCPGLRPEVFVGAEDAPIVGQTREQATVRAIDSMPHPKRHDELQEVPAVKPVPFRRGFRQIRTSGIGRRVHGGWRSGRNKSVAIDKCDPSIFRRRQSWCTLTYPASTRRGNGFNLDPCHPSPSSVSLRREPTREVNRVKPMRVGLDVGPRPRRPLGFPPALQTRTKVGSCLQRHRYGSGGAR